MTDSMQQAMDETNRRRAIQQAYNEENGITPESIVRPAGDVAGQHHRSRLRRHDRPKLRACRSSSRRKNSMPYIAKLENEMRESAKRFEFEKAAKLRDTDSRT